MENDNIVLRSLTIEDFSQEYLDWLNDVEINHYSFRRYFSTSKQDLIDFLNVLPTKKNEIHFTITIKSENIHIGNTSLVQIHWQARFAELGILIGNKNYWEKGLGTQTIQLVTEYAFNRLNLNRVEIGSFNPAAIRAFEKSGFKHEGVSREKIYINGKYYDDIRMAILASDFYKSY